MRLTRIRAITAAAAVGLVVATLLPAVAASAADDVIESATTDGAPVEITTTSAAQQAQVFFDGAAGRHLIVSCAPGTGASSYALQQTDGRELANRKCDADSSLNVNLLRVSGRLRLLFTGENGQPFSATVKVLMAEDVAGTITPDGAPLTLETANPEQNLSFALPLKAGQRVQIMCNATTSWSYFVMVDPRGNIFAPDSGSFGVCYSRATYEAGLYTATEAGTYRFVVYEEQRRRSYQATVSAISVPPDVTAELAADGTAVTVAVTAPYQRAKATLSLKTDTRVYITCEKKRGQHQEIELRLNMPNGYYELGVCSNAGGYQFFYNDTLVAGTSTLVIDPDDGYTGEITLRVQTVPAPVTAGLPLDGTPVTLETTTPGQRAEFTVEAEGGERVWIGCRLGPHRVPVVWVELGATVAFTHPGGQAPHSGVCRDPNDVATDNHPSAFGHPSSFGTSQSSAVTMTEAGTHTLTVRLLNAETNTVTLWAYRVPADVEATAAVDGTPVTVETTVSGQQAQVRFPGVAGNKYTVSCDTGNRLPGGVRLISPSGSSIETWDCSPAGKLTKPLNESGDFRLEFYFKKGVTGKATLKVTPAS